MFNNDKEIFINYFIQNHDEYVLYFTIEQTTMKNLIQRFKERMNKKGEKIVLYSTTL